MDQSRNDKISYFSLTTGGALLSLRLRDRFGGEAHLPRCHSLGCSRCSPFDDLEEALTGSFRAGETVVCVMAAGIVFRLLAPHLGFKQTDPAVIVMDEEGRHVIPLLGGHAAGANQLAREMAAFLGGEAVITTASDVKGLTAPDEVARRLSARVPDQAALRRVTAALVNGGPVCIESAENPDVDGYGWVPPGGSLEGYSARLMVSHRAAVKEAEVTDGQPAGGAIPTARLVPGVVTAGVGCRRGTAADEIVAGVASACRKAGIDQLAVSTIASIDLKEDEPGLREAAAELGARLCFFDARELEAAGRPGSEFVARTVGTPAVCEPAALLAAGDGAELAAGKSVFGPVTVALAVGRVASRTSGKVMVVGIGAGTAQLLTEEAMAAIGTADVVMGYHTYIEQIQGLFPGKEFIAGVMGKELDRCREALETAAAGQTVVMVSSGDPGVYGMAGPLLEMADGVPVQVIPGISAAQIAASRLGAPLMNDYVTLSLSDLLTPRDEILRRAMAAAASDLVVCLYNPTSRKRRPLFEEVLMILLRFRPMYTPVGWVRDAGGPEEEIRITDLGGLASLDTDMRTIVIVGNSGTEVIGGNLVTRRGYRADS